jgi:hypothetical protein
MARVKNPKTLSSHFVIDRVKLDRLGVLDPTLAIDTKLFIDPLLFQHSAHPELYGSAVAQYRRHFENVIKFLAATRTLEDVAWRSARRLLEFHEIRGTCLGYGAASIHGSGFGPELTDRLLRVGKEIVDLGIRDPDLFPAMALFEADIGPDRISDMATNVIRGALVAFNERILREVGITSEEFEVRGTPGHFLRNPFQDQRTPIILVPKDILRALPIAKDWDGVADAASKNEALRKRVNEHIGHIWASKTKRDKQELRAEALASKAAFQVLLDAIHRVPPRAYSVDADPDGLIKWAHVAKQFANGFPLDLLAFRRLRDIDAVNDLVGRIVEKFLQLIEHNGLNKELYKENGEPRHEATAQRLFFAIAHCYCEANNIDISPEVDTGTGQVDFKISKGFEAKVLVEIKLSTNPNIVHGYETQLETYKQSERTMRAYYIVIDVGRLGKKDEHLVKVRNKASAQGEPLSELVFIDGTLKASASKRRR